MLGAVDDSAAASTDAFLSSKLKFTTDNQGQEICLLKLDDGTEVGVMMGWETPIMERTVEALCKGHPQSQQLKVLNVGFGLGIVRHTMSRSGFLLKIFTDRRPFSVTCHASHRTRHY
jgi:protein arginine N-methyltransferase 2